MRMIRLWKHLHLLKRSGVGMLPGGVHAAAPGSCVVECPACPRDLPEFSDDLVEAYATKTSTRVNSSEDPDDEPPPLLPVE